MKKSILAVAAAAAMAISSVGTVPAYAASVFADINNLPWAGAATYIEEAYNQGLMAGYVENGKRYCKAKNNVTYNEAVQLKIPDIFAANRNSPGVYIPKPGNQVAHSRLARTGRADNSSGRSVRDRKADMIQNFSVCIGKVHIIKYNFRGCRNHIRPLFIHDWRIVNGICHIHRSRQHLQQGSHIPSVFQIIEHHKGRQRDP